MVPISALKGDGCDELMAEVVKLLPEGAAYFPEDQVTDQPERFLASEIVREKAIALTYHEVPHALAVMVDKWEETPKLLRIQMTLTVERASQKKILIGAQRRHAEEDRNARAQGTGRDSGHQDLSGTVREGGRKLARESDGGARAGLAHATRSIG